MEGNLLGRGGGLTGGEPLNERESGAGAHFVRYSEYYVMLCGARASISRGSIVITKNESFGK